MYLIAFSTFCNSKSVKYPYSDKRLLFYRALIALNTMFSFHCVYDAYTKQEKINLQRAHQIQGRIREMPDGQERMALHNELSTLRQNEFNIFKALIETAIKLRGKYPQKEYLEHLKGQAESIVNTVLR